MISLYQYDDYKKYFNDWVNQQPNNGHGEYRRLALALNVSTTLVSQIFKGDKDLSLEMACELSEYLHHNEDESEYFIILVEQSKAGSIKLKQKFTKQIKQRQNEAKKLEVRLKKDHVLNDEARQVYYSHWLYAAIRILVDIPDINSAEQISQKLSVPKNQVIKCLDFLIKHKIVVQKNNQLALGSAHIYNPPSDPLSNRNHMNWRQLGMNKMINHEHDQFFYTGVYALSEEAADEIRKRLPQFIEDVLKTVKPSPSETARCLSIDYFDI